MHTDFALLADAANIDASGKLSILGIFDHISAADFPTRHDRMTLVFRLVASLDEAGQHGIAITVHSPGGEELTRMDGQLQVGASRSGDGQVRMPQVVHMDGFVFPEPGRYSIDIAVGDQVIETVALTLTDAGRMAQA